MTTDLSLPVPAEMLLPHKAPFCLITSLVEFNDQAGVVETVLSVDNILLNEDGGLEPLALVELIAQSYAAVKGYDDLLKGRGAKRGFLVDVRDFRFDDRCHEGDRLIIKVWTVGSIGGFAVAGGDVICRGKVIASGKVKLWIPEEHESEREHL